MKIEYLGHISDNHICIKKYKFWQSLFLRHYNRIIQIQSPFFAIMILIKAILHIYKSIFASLLLSKMHIKLSVSLLHVKDPIEIIKWRLSYYSCPCLYLYYFFFLQSYCIVSCVILNCQLQISNHE